MQSEKIRVRGVVQGVGFRPTVWRLAKDNQLRGQVWNDSEGVLIHAWGTGHSLDRFVKQLEQDPPPLARIDQIERHSLDSVQVPESFEIICSQSGEVKTGVVADAATCPECLEEVMDPANRRYRYPFTNCTHCGPRLSIIHRVPYDRFHTSMSAFSMCPTCQTEYDDPADRRFHAQPNACPVCGPHVWLEDKNGEKLSHENLDPVDHAAQLIRAGAIVAIKGVGGIHLACDATNAAVVTNLRQRKKRYEKPFALMARDLDMIREFACVNNAERTLLETSAAPVVVLDALQDSTIADGVAPGQTTLGFMLPYTPLHYLLMQVLLFPIVLTSGNRSDEPQCISNEEAREKLKDISDYFLLHDREIVNRLDDSVVRVSDAPRVLRRGRGYAPGSFAVPPGFEKRTDILAMGAELKNTFCLLKNDRLILSQHIGDLENASTLTDYQKNLELYSQLFDHQPQIIAVDKHPDYFSTQLGQQIAEREKRPIVEVQHHHAHIAACMAEHQLPLETSPVLGIALDGLGLGDDGTLWGGEFLLADYSQYLRIAAFQQMPMTGGTSAIMEPWRNTFAHLSGSLGWETVCEQYADLEIIKFLTQKPVDTLHKMIESGLNSPLSSSCGRLFDAVAAALGVRPDRISYEGQAAIELENLARSAFLQGQKTIYPVTLKEESDRIVIVWEELWRSLLDDLKDRVAVETIAARFHQSLITGIAMTVDQLSQNHPFGTVVLNGGVFQNRLIQIGLKTKLQEQGFNVLVPELTPANDGGLSLGQAIIAGVNFCF